MKVLNTADLNKKIQEAMLSLPQDLFQQILDKVRQESIRRGLFIYDDDKKEQPVEIKLKPWVITAAQEEYTRQLSQILRKAINRIASLYFKDTSVRGTFPLTEDEEAWFKFVYPDGITGEQVIFERFDTNADFGMVNWRDFQFVEFNSVGVGCVYFAPVANEIINTFVLPVLEDKLGIKFRQASDYRQLLLNSIIAHASLINRPRPNIAFVERRECLSGGADELKYLIDYFREKRIQAFTVDPRDLIFKDDEIYYKEFPIDILYRDFQIDELISIEKHGGDIKTIKEAFRRNQVISSLAGEFDHKSICEFFTNPQFTRYFTFFERLKFKQHFLWTRLIYERKTYSPDGRLVDLTEYIKNNQETLVIKPNRGYGGEGVSIGHNMATSVWNDVIQDALSKPRTFVAQKLADIREDEFPVLRPDGKIEFKKNFVVSSFTSWDDSVTFLGRASEEKVVNISRGGGIIPIFLAAY